MFSFSVCFTFLKKCFLKDKKCIIVLIIMSYEPTVNNPDSKQNHYKEKRMIKYFSYVLWKRANDGKSKTLYRYILMTALIAAFAVSGIAMDTQAQSGLTYTFVDNTKDLPPSADTVTVIGHPLAYVIQNGDTLLDIARNYSLGYNELEDLYPELNPWI